MRKHNGNKLVIILGILVLVSILSIGYAAFQTDIKVTGKGNISKEKAAQILKKTVVTSGDGLYEDAYEKGRYVYKGANPDNYITFNNETWRIISVETDGTLKIIRNESLGKKRFDGKASRVTGYCSLEMAPSFGCNAWMASSMFVNKTYSGAVEQDAWLNTYLNTTYYNSLLIESKAQIINHIFSVGPVISDNSDLASQITLENSLTWTGNIALASVSDYLKANNNGEQCGTLANNNTNYNTCKTTNWMFNNFAYWFVSPLADSTGKEWYIYSDGKIKNDIVHGTPMTNEDYDGLPVLYLKSDLSLTGAGTEKDLYKIVS